MPSKEMIRKLKKLKCEVCGKLLYIKGAPMPASTVCFDCREKDKEERHKKLGLI